MTKRLPDRETVHLKLDRQLVRDVDLLAAFWDSYRNDVVERLLRESLGKYDPALQKVRDAGRDLWEKGGEKVG